MTERFMTARQTAWCPGCGNFSILRALQQALESTDLQPHQVLLVSGIGQAAKLPQYTNCNYFNGLHGRALPAATAAKACNHELTVIVTTGDGDCYGEGGNHLLHAIRRNPDITVFVHDNQIYGLTKGQASPTSDLGMRTKLQAGGVYNEPLNPLALAVALDVSFAARGFAGDVEHLAEIMRQAIAHRGFSLVDILQPCVSFNKVNTFDWYRRRVYRLEETGYDPADRMAAFQKSLEWGERIPTGVIFRQERPVFEDHFAALRQAPLVARQLPAAAELDALLDSFC
ncbi:thiamine pyrophosphate-dependent enzyme [Desulfotomaculum copahuensis]|uniref:2-oxoacid ferredoxin oxidoreductase n=1 Tax=Desulfotomaculum copahuensis TaxID=1838280 RepID=A0A1B7LF50_9FIRM|nr:thiamine pyrophosphate-dependent enzyme [Desulfotomaculum copahuensis]OAT82269.1 2-oxoacid ferredoxin oxidoreductase [Desulfotomaculum copahuensis]